MKRLSVLLLTILIFSFPGHALANNARDYLPLPAGTRTLITYFDFKFGNEYYHDSEKLSKDLDLDSTVGLLRPIYYTELWGMTVAPQCILPFGSVDVSGVQSNGIGDLQLAFTMFMINDTKNKFVFGYTPYLTVPTGQYDRERSVNLGDNRWATKQEIAFVKGFGENLWLEWYNSVEFFFDNDDAIGINNRKATSSKDLKYNAEVHCSYNLTKNFFTSLDYYFSYGGETELDGLDQDDQIRTHTGGLSFYLMLNDSLQAAVDYKQDLDVKNGIKTNGIMFRFCYCF